MVPGRNEAGHFVKGHPDFVKAAGVKAGRPKEMKRQVKDALAIAQDAMPQIIASMIVRAQGGTPDAPVPLNIQQQAAEYLMDRIYGRAKQQTELTGSALGPVQITVVYRDKGEGKPRSEQV
jgi:hypothetical protein